MLRPLFDVLASTASPLDLVRVGSSRASAIRRARSTFDMVVALLSLELHLPYAASLKDKRVVMRRLKDRLKKFNIAIAEVDHQNLWQRAGVGIVTVGASQQHVEQSLEAVAEEIERMEPGLVTRSELEFLT